MLLIKQYKKQFDAYVEKLSYNAEVENLYHPISYALSNKGKRLRPLILMMACDAFMNDIEVSLPAALSIEVFHNFTLLHDDIMDEAHTRRGKESVYKKFGISAAILSGDAMLIQSYKYLESYESDLYKILMNVFNKMAIGICEGQQLDLDFETKEDVDIGGYLKMIELKTALLMASALKMGGLIGGASNNQANHLYEFGKNLGIAFQLQDDILDTYGLEKNIGKIHGGDIIQKKKTYLYLKSLELLSGNDRDKFISLYNNDAENKVEKVIAYFDSVVIKEYGEQVKNAYLDLSLSHLNAIGFNSDKKEPFIKFAHFLVKREY